MDGVEYMIDKRRIWKVEWKETERCDGGCQNQRVAKCPLLLTLGLFIGLIGLGLYLSYQNLLSFDMISFK